MIDPFGNYLCQKILELISQDDICDVSGKIREKIVLISHNQHGTRSVQKLVEVTKCKNNIQKIGNVLRNDVINLAKVSIVSFLLCFFIFQFDFFLLRDLFYKIIRMLMEIMLFKNACNTGFLNKIILFLSQ